MGLGLVSMRGRGLVKGEVYLGVHMRGVAHGMGWRGLYLVGSVHEGVVGVNFVMGGMRVL